MGYAPYKAQRMKSPITKRKDPSDYYPQSQQGMGKMNVSEPYELGKDNWVNMGNGYRANYAQYEPISKVISDSDEPQTVKDREISSHIGPRQATISGKLPQTLGRREYEPQSKKKKKK